MNATSRNSEQLYIPTTIKDINYRPYRPSLQIKELTVYQISKIINIKNQYQFLNQEWVRRDSNQKIVQCTECAIIFILRKLNFSRHTWNTIYKKKQSVITHMLKIDIIFTAFKVKYKIAKPVAISRANGYKFITRTLQSIDNLLKMSIQPFVFRFCQSQNIIIIMITLIMEEEQ